MGGRTYEALHINIDIMSTVGWQGYKLSEQEIEKLKEKLNESLQDLIYDTVVHNFEDDWGDSGLDDFTVRFDIEHQEDK